MNADSITPLPLMDTTDEPQIGDIVLVAVGGGYIMRVLALDPGQAEPYCCRTFPDASYIWESHFPRSSIYQILIRANGTLLADPESLPLRNLRHMQQTGSCVWVYDDPAKAPWNRSATEREGQARSDAASPTQIRPPQVQEKARTQAASASRITSKKSEYVPRSLWDPEPGGTL